MKKKCLFLFLAVICALSITACSRGGQAKPSAPIPTVMDSKESTTKTFTGILDTKKDFMIVVLDNDDNAYVFTTVNEIDHSIKKGDRLTITYTGDLEDKNSELKAEKIVKISES